MLVILPLLLIASVTANPFRWPKDVHENLVFSSTLFEDAKNEEGVRQIATLTVPQDIMVRKGQFPPGVQLVRLAYRVKTVKFKDGYIRYMFEQSHPVAIDEIPHRPETLTPMDIAFLRHEAETLSTPRSALEYLKVEPDFLNTIMSGPFPKLPKGISGLVHLSLNERPDLTKKILLHPHIAELGPVDGYVKFAMDPVKYGEVLASLFMRENPNIQMLTEVLDELTPKKLGVITLAILKARQKGGKWPPAGPILFFNPRFVSRLDESSFRPIMDQVFIDAKEMGSFTRLISRPHIVERLSAEELSAHLVYLTTSVNNEELLLALNAEEFMTKVSDAAIGQVVADFLRTPSQRNPEIVKVLISMPYISSRLTTPQVEDLLKLAVSSDSWTAAVFFTDAAVMDRISQPTLEMVFDFMVAHASMHKPDLLVGLTQEHIVSRIDAARWTSLIVSIMESEPTSAFMQQPELTDAFFNNAQMVAKIQENGEAVAAAVSAVVAHPPQDGTVMKTLLASHFGQIMPDEAYAQLLKNAHALKYTQSVDALLSSPHNPDHESMLSMYRTIREDKSTFSKLSPKIKDSTARFVAGKHRLTQKILPEAVRKGLFDPIQRRPLKVANSVVLPARVRVNVPKVGSSLLRGAPHIRI